MMRTVSRPLCSLRSAMTTEAPSAASAMAVARPIPEPPPVMRATLPLGSMVLLPSVGWRCGGSLAHCRFVRKYTFELVKSPRGVWRGRSRGPPSRSSRQPEGLDLVRVGAVEAAGRRRTRLPHVRPLGGVEEDGHEVFASKMAPGA